MPTTTRLDDVGLFFARELEKVLDKVFDVEYTDITYSRVLPISTEVDNASESYTYRIYDAVGSMKPITDKSDDLPRADVIRREVTMPVTSYGSSFGYTFQEVRAAAKVPGMSLEQRRANAVRRVYEETVQRVAYFGEPSRNLRGFLNSDQVDKIVPNKWFDDPTLTPDEALELLNEPQTRIVDNSNMKEAPDTMLLPYPVLRKLSTMRVSTVSDTTVLEFFLDTNPMIKNIEPLNELSASKSGGFLTKDRVITYQRNSDKLELHLPQMLEFFPAQASKLSWLVPAHARHGGTAIYYPRSVNVLEKA